MNSTQLNIASSLKLKIKQPPNKKDKVQDNNWRKLGNKKRKSRPISRVLSWTAIHLGDKSPYRSSDLPESHAGRVFASLFDLAPSGVYPAIIVTNNAVRSYRTISPLPQILNRKKGGIFSAALSVGSHLPGVTWRSALWSPDFPL